MTPSPGRAGHDLLGGSVELGVGPRLKSLERALGSGKQREAAGKHGLYAGVFWFHTPINAIISFYVLLRIRLCKKKSAAT